MEIIGTPVLENACSKYGADMGRRDRPGDPVSLVVTPVAMSSCGAYDIGGAYWGVQWGTLYRVWSLVEETVFWVREYNAARAVEKLELEPDQLFRWGYYPDLAEIIEGWLSANGYDLWDVDDRYFLTTERAVANAYLVLAQAPFEGTEEQWSRLLDKAAEKAVMGVEITLDPNYREDDEE